MARPLATPRDIAHVLTRLKFRVTDKDPEADGWESRNGKVFVTVYDNGQWTIMYEEVRERGSGARQLVQKLKGFLEVKVQEMTGTGAVGGFGTPHAFSTKAPVSSKPKKRKKGYTVSETANDKILKRFDKLIEGGDPYYAWRNDETATPRQKIGAVISEMNKQLREMEKVVKRSQRLKTEMGVPNSGLWKRTNSALMKIESRMHKISQTIRNMRG